MLRIIILIVLALFAYHLPISASAQSGQLPPDITNEFIYYPPPKQKLTGRLAFTTKIGAWQRIFSLDLQSKKITPIITGPGNNFYPSWSPDGSQLAFVSDRDGNNEIYFADWLGLNPIRLTNNKIDDANPHWATNPELITYSSGSDKNSNILQVNIQTKKIEQLTKSAERATTPKTSPDNQQLAYSTNRNWPGWDICILNLQNDQENCPLGGPTSHCRPDWTKDSKRLTYARGDGKQINIGIYDFETKQSELFTNLAGRHYDPVWGPEEKFLFFVAEPEGDENYDIYIRILGERDPLLLLKSPYPIRFLSFSPHSTLSVEAKRHRQTSE